MAPVHDAEVFSKPAPVTRSLRAARPAVVELGRSKDGPPGSVVMQPGLVVVPPWGYASNDTMVVLRSPAVECSGVNHFVVAVFGAEAPA